MRILSLLLILLSVTFARAAEPNIIVQSRFNKEWSALFLQHMRSVLMQNGVGDPYHRTLEQPIVLELGPRVAELASEGGEWYGLLLKYLKIDLLKSDFRLVMDRLNYQVESVDVAVSPATRNSEMLWTMSHDVTGLQLGADSITLEVALHSTRGEPIKFAIQVVGAHLKLDDMKLPLTAVWRSRMEATQVDVALQKFDLRAALKGMQENPERVVLSIQDIVVPPLAVRIGSRTITVEPAKVRQWIFTRQDGLKKFLLDVMVLKNLDSFEDLTGEDDPSFKLPRQLFAAGETLSAAIGLDGLVETQAQVRAHLNGWFCLPREATDLESCVATAPRNPRADRQGRDHEASLRKIFEDLEKKDANIIVSLGEPYINQAITAAINSGILAEAFGESEVTLAPGGALTRLDTAGEVFHGYIHLQTKLSGWIRRLVGRSVITFPIKLGIKLKLEQKDGQPNLIIEVAQAEASRELLLKGLPDVGMASNIASVPRFRNKVIETVQESVQKFTGKQLIEVPLPFLKGTFFEKTQFKTDGFGRANALFKVEEKHFQQ